VPKNVWDNLSAHERHDLRLRRLILMRRSPAAVELEPLTEEDRQLVQLRRRADQLWNRLGSEGEDALLGLCQLGYIKFAEDFPQAPRLFPGAAGRLSDQRSAARQAEAPKPALRLIKTG